MLLDTARPHSAPCASPLLAQRHAAVQIPTVGHWHASPSTSRPATTCRTVHIHAASPQAVDRTADSNDASTGSASSRTHDTDYVVIGSGIGGLCCAALLARYGHKVTVCESHYLAGGAAQSFDIKGYQFDAGPSFFAGLSGEIGSKSSNPLKQVLNAVEENVECATYDRWILHTPSKSFPVVCDGDQYRAMIRREGGQKALEEWIALENAMKPLQTGAASFPAAAIRSDLGIALTALRFGPSLAKTGLMAGTLTGPFGTLVDQYVKDPWLRKNIDLECFVLSGMVAKDTITAEMAFMFGERNSGQSTIDYPLEGTKGIVEALIRGIEKFGGRVMLRSHVEQIVMEGLKAEGLPEDLDCHHLVVNDFDDIEKEQNVCIASIPTVFNPQLAPPGKALLHAYCAANEPYSHWEGLDRKGPDYKRLKDERSQVLWRALERAIPDIRDRTELCLVGSPLTHERYLNRDRGTYGAAISAAESQFPGPQTDVPGLYRCGDSTAPGIGVPAAAASGMICANTLSSVWSHLQLLSDLAY